MSDRFASLSIGAVVLAAGRSTRMGSQKLLVPFGGISVISHVVQQVLAAALGPVVVVLGSDADDIARVLPQNDSIVTTYNDAYAMGMGTSISCGLGQIPDHVDACLVCLGDMPYLTAYDYRVVAASALSFDARSRMIVPQFEGVMGHPVCFGRAFFSELLQLAPEDRGARVVIDRHPSAVHIVQMDTAHVLWDVDRPEDLHRGEQAYP